MWNHFQDTWTSHQDPKSLLKKAWNQWRVLETVPRICNPLQTFRRTSGTSRKPRKTYKTERSQTLIKLVSVSPIRFFSRELGTSTKIPKVLSRKPGTTWMNPTTLTRVSTLWSQKEKLGNTSRKFAAQIMTTGRTSETPFKELWSPLKKSWNQLEKHLLYSTLLCSSSSNLVCWSPVLRSWLTLVETSTGRGRGQPHPWSAPTAGHVTSGHWSHGLSDQCTSWIWLLGENRWLTFSKLTEQSTKRTKKRER